MTSPVLSVIVISYNTREMTLDCLRSVQRETETAFELIVVDNASADGSGAAIAAEFPDIRLLAEAENHGFARANNLAAQQARGDYILLLNPDTVVLDGAIDQLLAFARARPAAQIWGGRTLNGDRSLNPASCWRKMTLWNVFCRTVGLSGLFRGTAVFNSEAYGGWDRGDVRAVDIVSGCFLLILRPLWEQLGGFDLRFVMYGEEADLCLRARALGADPHVTPAARIIHYGGASETVRADKMVRLLRAKVTLIRRHFPAWQKTPGVWFFSLWPWMRWRIMSLAAALTRRPDLAGAAGIWAEIWARRGEWRAGYGDQGIATR